MKRVVCLILILNVVTVSIISVWIAAGNPVSSYPLYVARFVVFGGLIETHLAKYSKAELENMYFDAHAQAQRDITRFLYAYGGVELFESYIKSDTRFIVVALRHDSRFLENSQQRRLGHTYLTVPPEREWSYEAHTKGLSLLKEAGDRASLRWLEMMKVNLVDQRLNNLLSNTIKEIEERTFYEPNPHLAEYDAYEVERIRYQLEMFKSQIEFQRSKKPMTAKLRRFIASLENSRDELLVKLNVLEKLKPSDE